MKRTIRTTLSILIVTLILAFGFASPAAAQGIIYGSSIPAGTTVDHDVLLVGQDVVVDGTVNGNVFVLGNQVAINGTVDGSLVLVGQNAGLGGEVDGGVYAVALTLDLGPKASLGRDLYTAAVSLTSGSGSTIARDLYAVGLDSGLSGHVGRDLHTVIGPIQLYNGIMHLLGFDELTIRLHIDIPQPAATPSGSLIPGGHRALLRPSLQPAPARFDWEAWGLGLLRSWAVLFLIGLLIFWRLRRPLVLAGDQLREKTGTTAGVGLLVLVIAFALVGVAILLAVLVFSIGLGLNALGLWQFSLGFWALAYSALGLALAGLWLALVYGTKIAVIFLAATWAFGKLFRRHAVWLDILALLAGTLVYELLYSIPYIGWIFGVLATAAGAGALWLAYRARKAAPAPETAGTVKKPARRPLRSAAARR